MKGCTHRKFYNFSYTTSSVNFLSSRNYWSKTGRWLFTIFCLWLQLKKDKDQKDREKIRLFVNFFHSQTGDNESPTTPPIVPLIPEIDVIKVILIFITKLHN